MHTGSVTCVSVWAIIICILVVPHVLVYAGPYTGGGGVQGGALAPPFQINDIQLAHLKHPFIEIFNAHLHFSNHF